jgi:ubiquinone/menaquinone biosynthesis C-methylase UbiE
MVFSDPRNDVMVLGRPPPWSIVDHQRMSRLMSLIYDRFMRASERACLEAWRTELLADLSGSILEIGAGTGANFPRYPPAVTRLVLVDDDPHMLAKLEARVSETRRERDREIEIRDASALSLPFPDASFDAVVSTLVLCSVPDVDAVLREIRRVLRPNGAFIYLEHVADEEGTSRFAWQRRVEPFCRRIAGNFHLTRRTGEAIRRAGFVVEDERRESMRKALPIVRPTVRGIARPA